MPILRPARRHTSKNTPMTESTPENPAAAKESLAILRRYRSGALLASDTATPVRFVLDPHSGRVLVPVPREVEDAEQFVLFLPEESETALQLLLFPAKESPAEAITDRWRIYHLTPPSIEAGEYDPVWRIFVIDTARLRDAVIDGEFLTIPNPLISIEPTICKTLNADKPRLARLCRAEAGFAVESPVCVGIDPEGMHIRTRLGVERIPFETTIKTPAAARDHVEAMLSRAVQ